MGMLQYVNASETTSYPTKTIRNFRKIKTILFFIFIFDKNLSSYFLIASAILISS